jgi:hypothetical protein
VKRSHTVDLVLLLSAAATLESCSHQQCVDERDIVVNDNYCQSSNIPGPHGYRFYNGGWYGRVPIGGSVRDSAGTMRGVFGNAGESAAHGGGGEGGGGGE